MENNEKKMASTPIDMPITRWTIDQSKCTTCCECVDACLLGLLKYVKNVIVIEHENWCTQCGDCAAACGQRAIVLT